MSEANRDVWGDVKCESVADTMLLRTNQLMCDENMTKPTATPETTGI